jgi:hypothetical protein
LEDEPFAAWFALAFYFEAAEASCSAHALIVWACLMGVVNDMGMRRHT